MLPQSGLLVRERPTVIPASSFVLRFPLAAAGNHMAYLFFSWAVVCRPDIMSANCIMFYALSIVILSTMVIL